MKNFREYIYFHLNLHFYVNFTCGFCRPEKYEKDIRDIVEYFEKKKEKRGAGSGDEVDTRFVTLFDFTIFFAK